MKKLLTLLFISFSTFVSAQYEIKIHTNNFDDNKLIISYPNGERPEILDTIKGDSTGLFVFKSHGKLNTGVYFVGKKGNKQMYKLILMPDEKIFDVVLTRQWKPNNPGISYFP